MQRDFRSDDNPTTWNTWKNTGFWNSNRNLLKSRSTSENTGISLNNVYEDQYCQAHLLNHPANTAVEILFESCA